MTITRSDGKNMLYMRGWIYCPVCGASPKLRNGGKLIRIRFDTLAKNLPVYCSNCKREYVVDIEI